MKDVMTLEERHQQQNFIFCVGLAGAGAEVKAASRWIWKINRKYGRDVIYRQMFSSLLRCDGMAPTRASKQVEQQAWP